MHVQLVRAAAVAGDVSHGDQAYVGPDRLRLPLLQEQPEVPFSIGSSISRCAPRVTAGFCFARSASISSAQRSHLLSAACGARRSLRGSPPTCCSSCTPQTALRRSPRETALSTAG
jgi:hypothetical protein